MIRRLSAITLTIVLAVLGSTIPEAAQANDEQVDLEALYQQIDKAIDEYPQYVADREQQISNARQSYLTSDGKKKLQAAEQLFELFKPYKNDSALCYAAICVGLADSLQLSALAGRYRSQQARQCSNAGMYVEALDLLNAVDKTQLDRQGITKYYEAWMHVCGEIGSHSDLKDVRQAYYDRQDAYRDTVLQVADPNSEEYLHLKMDVLNARQQYQEALRVSNRWLGKVSEGTHENAFAAFSRSVVYDKLSNPEQVRYWLGRSALDDIRCAVTDQASLLFLAEHLADEGDIARALRYMEFARSRNLFFCPRMRAYQVDPVINIIEKSNEAVQHRADLTLIIAAAIIICLLISLIVALLLIRKK